MQTSTGPIPKDAAAVILLRHNTNHQDPEVFLVKRSEEHTSELQSRSDLVCRLLLDKKNSVNVAVEAMRRGARDFIQKPCDNARLLTIMRTQLALAEALRRGQPLEAENLTLPDDGAS